MTIVCPECGSVNKKGNKFCFECGMKLPAEVARSSSSPNGAQPGPLVKSKSDEKRLTLKKRWLKGEISAEEYRGHLLKMRLKEKFGSQVAGSEIDGKDEQARKE